MRIDETMPGVYRRGVYSSVFWGICADGASNKHSKWVLVARFDLQRIVALSVLAVCLWATGSAVAADKPYPFTDPYKATVFGTPPDAMYPVQPVPRVSMRSFEVDSRPVPDIFWYADELEYSVALQRKPAPLMFLIAGTGADHDAGKMRFLRALFYEAGYHVACLSSPTHYNFIVSASRHAAAGYVPHDVEDLYRVMRWVAEDINDDAEVTGYSVAGYSLGGMHSAFLARMDSEEKHFNFVKVLMLNPAVNLYGSALRFDSWLDPNNTGGKTVMEVMDEFYRQFAEFYKTREIESLDSEVLYQLSQYVNGSDTDFKILIGTSFRVTAASMIFTSDVCLSAGYVVPSDTFLTTTDPLLPYFTAASKLTFEQYFEEYLYPYLRYLGPPMTEGEAIYNCSLMSIEEYLRSAENIYVVGNLDDPILSGDEVKFLQDVFGDKAYFFEHGGHCGNMMYAPYVRRMLEFTGEVQQ